MPLALRTAIDIGTNTLLALSARVGSNGVLERVGDWATITRLGAGVDRTRRLAPDAMARALGALEEFVLRARGLGTTEIAAVATSAVRDAENRDEFLARARDITGGEVSVIDGAREAELTFRGALADTNVAAGTEILVFDVGGGSTELISGVAAGAIRSRVSIDVGSVRLTERLIANDPPTDRELDDVRAAVRDALAPIERTRGTLIGVAGTVTTLAAIDAEINTDNGSAVHGRALGIDAIDRVAARIAGMTTHERQHTIGIDARRADVIVAGAILVKEVVGWHGSSQLVVSNGGVRVGLLLEIARD